MYIVEVLHDALVGSISYPFIILVPLLFKFGNLHKRMGVVSYLSLQHMQCNCLLGVVLTAAHIGFKLGAGLQRRAAGCQLLLVMSPTHPYQTSSHKLHIRILSLTTQQRTYIVVFIIIIVFE